MLLYTPKYQDGKKLNKNRSFKSGGTILYKKGDKFKAPKGFFKTAKEVEKFNKKYTKSDHFADLMTKAGYTPEQIQARQDEIADFKTRRQTNLRGEGGNYVYQNEDKDRPQIDYNMNDAAGLEDWGSWENIQAHEYGHLGVSSGAKPLSAADRKLLNDRNLENPANQTKEKLTVINKKGEKFDLPNKVKFFGQDELEDNLQHDLEPQEGRADLFELRYDLDKAGIYDSSKGGVFNKEMLNKYIKNVGSGKSSWNRLLRLYKPEDIIELMNSVAMEGDSTENNLT